MTQAYEMPPERGRPGMVLAIVAGVLVLAVIGGAVGWVAAGDGGDAVVDAPTYAPSTAAAEPTVETTSPVPASPSAPPSASQPGGSFALPDLTGTDFQQARRQLRELKLGVQLVFAASGDDRTVARTEPAAGTAVQRGRTIKVYVRGQAPLATVPGVMGLVCSDAAAIVVDHGLFPRYPTGRLGTVRRQDPPPGEGTLRWNDQVTLECAVASPTTG